MFEPDEIDDLVTTEVGGSALFASRFRECAARALLLPRRDPGRRSPLWQQRQRSAALLEVASKYGSFPIVLEAVRECLQDVYDVPALVQLMRDIESRRIRVVEVETQTPSAFARSLLFGYVAAFVYEGDSPLAERKAAALALDPALLGELLGRTELRDLLDPDVVDQIERRAAVARRRPQAAQRSRASPTCCACSVRSPATSSATRCTEPGSVDRLGRRADVRPGVRSTVRIGGQRRWSPRSRTSARLRDALGVPVPPGVPEAFTDPVGRPARRPGRPVRPHATARSPPPTSPAASRSAWRSRTTR